MKQLRDDRDVNARRVRRPEVARVAADLQRKNPRLSEIEALTQAKARVTRPRAN